MARLATLHRKHGATLRCNDRRRPRELARLAESACGQTGRNADAVLPRRAWLRRLPRDAPGGSLDGLLLAGGEAAWLAGPLVKGSNLCHGTGGNGYAFLKLYARTGDTLWLDRARAFAMHAIRQTEADAAQYGRMRYSLWTGDPGLAIYLWDCINGTARFPTLDVFFAD